ncbi:histidine--tRNA ligase [Tumebacillus permanentifrigoris]|uniref:Histidine--tRNA ligase n=1 Tax=Tumebacillus permanentifrigoris TaxID=378543 RepID=A0A316D5P5_9BACL|nr:histidine--tRNA ligase [Tumebacillus permanentifrigoris]PWK09063.1 histidyl-tRNA synthetase [Tumebacillus permanentifrigoris]
MLTNRPRGVNDILPGDVEKWQWIERTARDVCRRFNVSEIRTPIFEHTELFTRGVGETTDIVEKEMYSFQDRGERSLTLRPEGTASAVRAFVENKMHAQPQPTKLFYIGPMFRYERPQAGRYRQFHQFGAEVIGVNDPSVDAEIIALAMTFFTELGLKNITLEINSVGSPESREVYRNVLREHLAPVKDQLCKDCQSRYDRNPMRILDCKVDACKQLIVNPPFMLDHLTEEDTTHFAQVREYLDSFGVDYKVNPRMVRGLDYYTQTAFEFIESGSTLSGGGRYNGMVQQLGGPDLSGIGFAVGIERVLIALQNQAVQVPLETGIDVFLVALGEAAQKRSVTLLQELRTTGLVADKDYLGKSMKAQMKAADRLKARQVVLLGDDELAAGIANVKNMETGEQVSVPLSELVEKLQQKL